MLWKVGELVAGQNYNYLINNMERFESEEASYKEGDYLAAYKQESNILEEIKPQVTFALPKLCSQ